MKTFEDSDRYNYPLTRDSIVIDAGGYEGNWADEINRKYACHIRVFEPVKRFYDKLVERFAGNPLVKVAHCGLGGAACGSGTPFKFHVQNDSSGVFAGSPDIEEVTLYSAACVIGGISLPIALLKLNIEGMEFDVLENLLDSGHVKGVRDIQVQFHPIVPDCRVRRDQIRERLSATHELTYDCPWIWENWKLK